MKPGTLSLARGARPYRVRPGDRLTCRGALRLLMAESELGSLAARVGALEEKSTRIQQQVRELKLMDLLFASAEFATREREPHVHTILMAIVGALLTDGDRVLRSLADVAQRWERTHLGLRMTSAPPDYVTELALMVSQPEPPTGADARELATRLERWLVDANQKAFGCA